MTSPPSILFRLVLAFFLLAPGLAAAQKAPVPPPKAGGAPTAPDLEAAARGYFERGVKLYQEQRYLEALAEFSAGYELSRRPLFLFNMGECARLAKQPERAKEYYERYLREEPTGKFAETATARLAAMGVKPAGPTATAPAPVSPKHDTAKPDAPKPAPAAPGPDKATPPIATAPNPTPAPKTGPIPARKPTTPAVPTPKEAARQGVGAETGAGGRGRPDGAGGAGGAAHGQGRAIWQRWPFWAAVGAAVVGGTVIAIAVSNSDDDCPSCVVIDLRSNP